jgi:ABC-type phosphate/phosphonate transport system substrate-binding protein
MRLRVPVVTAGALVGLFGLAAVAVRAADSPTGPADVRPALRVGAVAYAPSAVTVFEGIRRYCGRNGLPVDYVLYSNYDALVDALLKGQVDVAWNTPLAHAQYHLRAGSASRTLVMRDVDCGFRSTLIARRDSGVTTLGGLAGKTLILGSREAAEATVLPLHFLKGEKLDLDRVSVLCLDGELDLRGNPCSSEVHVLKALQQSRGQAAVIGSRLWERLKREQPEQAAGLIELWTSPPFSHCVFTAGMNLDDDLAQRFTGLMLAMDPSDPLTAEVMRLEGTRKWVAGSAAGFGHLIQALEHDPVTVRSTPAPSGPSNAPGRR